MVSRLDIFESALCQVENPRNGLLGPDSHDMDSMDHGPDCPDGLGCDFNAHIERSSLGCPLKPGDQFLGNGDPGNLLVQIIGHSGGLEKDDPGENRDSERGGKHHESFHCFR